MRTLNKIEIIEETAAFYHSENRGLNEDGRYLYITGDGKMCAVGRCALKKQVKTIRFLEDFTKNKNFQKQKYKGHCHHFWRNLQEFHDDSRNWNEKGLTCLGEAKKLELIQKWEQRKEPEQW